MRKKIIGMSVVIAVLAMLCAQSVAAQAITTNVWTDKPQYNPGEKGILKISMLNEYSEPVSIYNITIEYPWHAYDAKAGEWVGNDTIKGDTSILKTMTEKGSADDHYYKEVEFTVPSDGRADSGRIYIDVWTSKGIESPPGGYIIVSVAVPSPASLVDLNMWMTSLIAAVVICTIILAIVIFLATRGARAPRAFVPGAQALPPPPKPKAKTE